MTTATEPQHLQALGWANTVRLTNAALKREVAAMERGAGLERVAELIEGTTDPITLRAKVGYLLTMPHRHGKAWSDRLLRKLDIPREKRLGELPERQRLMLAQAVRELRNGGSHRIQTAQIAGFVRVI